MRPSLGIGDFARATHLSIKALRHYHRIGLLEPAAVDPATGYRHYTTDQIPAAQIIRRFRALDVPLNEIHAVLVAPDLRARNELIAVHLDRLEVDLARTQRTIASLRDLIERPSLTAPVVHRSVAAARVAAIRATVDRNDALSWFQGALGELYATLAAQHVPTSGSGGGIFSNRLFSLERGQATIFIPAADTVRPMGRVLPLVIPAAELATTVHAGPYTDIDRAYGSLATYVTQHALAVDGPIREYYLISGRDTPDETAWRTEIGWPIFNIGAN